MMAVSLIHQKIITDMVQRAKKKGMDVILVKQQGRNGDAQRNSLLTSRWYAWELEQVGSAENCQVVDLFNLWQNYCISIGAEKTTELYMNGDTLHPNRAGAEKLAELFSTQFKQTPAVTDSFDDFKKQLAVHNRNYNNFPMRPLNWKAPLIMSKLSFALAKSSKNFFVTHH